jgi:hypothetical protein
MLQAAKEIEAFLNMQGDVVMRQVGPHGQENRVVIPVLILPELLAKLQVLAAPLTAQLPNESSET